MNSTIQITSSLAGLVREKQAKHFLVNEAIAELIDNSVDAGAKNICIRLYDSDMHIIDDGHGFDDLGSALNIGVSNKRELTGNIGRYGVGLKDCAIKFSSKTTISSRGKMVTADWDLISSEESDGTCEIFEAQQTGQTEIILHGYRSKTRSKHQLNPDRIAKIYTQLLKAEQVKIEINGQFLKPLDAPKLKDKIDTTLEYRGRKIHISGGVFKSDDPLRKNWRGYNVYYHGRLIRADITDAGVEDETCTNWFFNLDLVDD